MASVLSLLCAQVNHNTKRMEYDGAVLNMVMAMADLAHGGQILMDEASFDLVKSGLVQLYSCVEPGPDLAALQDQLRHAAQALFPARTPLLQAPVSMRAAPS